MKQTEAKIEINKKYLLGDRVSLTNYNKIVPSDLQVCMSCINYKVIITTTRYMKVIISSSK